MDYHLNQIPMLPLNPPGNILYEKLLNEKFDVCYYDELIMSQYTDNFNKFIDDCDVIVITHDTNKFSNLGLNDKIIINPWNVKI